MIDRYRPKRLMDAIGRRVRTKMVLTTTQMEIPAGSVLTVERNTTLWGNLRLKGAKCPHCGVAPVLTVSAAAVIFLAPDEALPLPPMTNVAEDRLAALQLVRRSNGWHYLARETKDLIDAAIAGVPL